MVVSVENVRATKLPRNQALNDWAISARTASVVVGAFSVVALILSCIDLTTRSLSLDEGTTWQVASVPNSHLLAGISGQGANMALYYVVMHVIAVVFGSSVLALRVPSVIAGVSLVPLTYLIGTRFSRPVGLLASGLGAVSLPIILWAQNARAYTLGTALVAASVLFLLRAMERDRWTDWALWALFSSMAVYSLTVAVLVILAELVALLMHPRASTPWRHLGLAIVGLAASGSWMAWVVLGLGRTPSISWVASTGSTSHSSQSFGLVATLSSAQADGYYLDALGRILVVLTALLWIVAVAPPILQLLRHGRSEISWRIGLLVLWLTLPLLLGLVAPPIVHVIFHQISKNSLIIDRYYLVGVPAGTLLAAIGLARLPLRLLTLGGFGVLVALRGVTLVPAYGVSLNQFVKPTDFVLANSQPGDCITFRTPGPRVDYAYYVLHASHSQRYDPKLVLPPEPDPSNAIELSHQLFDADEAFWAVPPVQVTKSELFDCRRLWFFEWGVRGSTDLAQPPLLGNVANVNALLKVFDSQYSVHRSHQFSDTTLTLYQRHQSGGD